MDFDPVRLEAFFDLLVQSGIEEFEGFGLHIKFSASMFTPDRVVQDAGPEQVMAEREPPKSVWEEPRLWPGGKPPEFPK